MKLIHTENYEAMSKEAADLLLDTLRKKPDAVICLATGSSPARMYELVCEAVNRERIDLSEITIRGSWNEWYGVEPSGQPVRVPPLSGSICWISCICSQRRSLNLCPMRQISGRSWIGWMCFYQSILLMSLILGLGMNGHLGLNEPADFLTLNAHYAELDEKTKHTIW